MVALAILGLEFGFWGGVTSFVLGDRWEFPGPVKELIESF
jgi:hypothetical protein